MAYIGRQLARGENKLFDDISSSFNGSTTVFNLTVSSVATSTATPYQLFVSLGGVMQKPNTDFTTAGNQITFTTAPAAGLSCWIMMQGDTIDQAAIPDASVTPSKISGSNFAFSGDLRLKDADGSHYVGFASPSTVSSNKVWTLPAADGSANQVLRTNGSGVLSWAADSTVTEGTAVLSTGESSTNKYLRTDGDGTCSWQTIDTSTYMLLTGGTFTGDVTFDGATAGRDIVFDRSDNALEFADNAKATFGTGDDFYIASGGTGAKLHANNGVLEIEGDSVQIWNSAASEAMAKFIADGAVELYHNNVKKIETSAAGVSITGALTVSTNATITGDLTVSGTTTTINTQTLDVEDKNVVIGKVSSPSDTTADGGGWTLKGASDKTFNWVNSTDAWTSSEHIHVLDNKKLLVGTGSDLSIYHDGTDSIISNATNVLKTHSSHLFIRNAAGNEDIAKFVQDGAVELYHDNSKKLETTSGGINVTGAINVNGSALSTAPQITATASGALTAGDRVIVNTNGTVSKVGLSYTAISPIDGLSGSDVNYPDSSTDTSDWRVAKIQDNYFIAVYKNETNSNRMDGAQFYIQNDGTVTTNASVQTILSSDHYILDIAHDPVRNQALLVYYRSNGRIYFQTIRKDSNTGFATGSAVMLTGAFNAKSSSSNASLSYDTAANKFIFVLGDDDANSSNLNVRYVDVTGNDAITIGSPVQIESTIGAFVGAAFDSTAGKHLIVYRNGGYGSDIKGVVATLSGTSISLGTAVAIATGNSTISKIAYSTTDSKFLLSYFSDATSSADVKYKTITISGTSLSAGSTVSVTVNTAGNNGDASQLVYDPSLNKFYHIYRENYVGKLSPLTLSGTSVTRGTTVNSRSGNSVADQSVAYDSASNRFLFVFQNGSTNKGLYQVWNSSSSTTNLTTENYIGVAAASASDSASATIDVSGATNSNQSSLTSGQKYFVQNDGSLGLTAATPKVFAGTAVSATKLIVNDQAPATAVVWDVLGTDDFSSTNASLSENRGWTTDYTQVKCIFSWIGRSTGSTYSDLSMRFYFADAYGSNGTLYSSGNEYKYGRRYTSWGSSSRNTSNGTNTRWRICNGGGSPFWSGEITFYIMKQAPTSDFKKWATANIERVGDFGEENCEHDNDTTKRDVIVGARLFEDGGNNFVTGRVTWYGLRYS